MQVLDFYALTQDEQHFWLEQISKTKWDAADFLISIILKEEFYSTLGNDSKLYLLTHQNESLEHIVQSEIVSVLSISAVLLRTEAVHHTEVIA